VDISRTFLRIASG